MVIADNISCSLVPLLVLVSVFPFLGCILGFCGLGRGIFILSYFEAKLQKPGQTGAPGKPCSLFDFTQP